jgi:hypothetical protein
MPAPALVSILLATADPGPTPPRYEQAFEATPDPDGFLHFGWNTANYAIGYAICTSPSGPCTKPLDHPWLGSNFTAQGPGGQEFFTDPSGQLWMVMHAWVHGDVGYPSGARSVFVLRVVFQGGVPEAA